ncbi:TVP38/TMEM64 family protein [Paucibacter sp. Y2R2-4]|uniref:TVP38/TMEM64 family protein n=1 Tax=Paucibacter sp. Y2R2-4 TaxID=2893553 RepID=UPI0021E43886|nr:VTT domain-containing protein [Paucibacter sp. Y2R2-4]MCV2352099.1 VTT domain-containing protein [Paucibacter sp. Y2R2-4]
MSSDLRPAETPSKGRPSSAPNDSHEPEELTADRHVRSARFKALTRLLVLGACLITLITLAVYWSAGSQDLKQSLALLQASAQSAGPGWVLALFTLALSLAVPLGLLALLVIAVLGPWAGFATVLIGALISASISHAIGHHLGHQALQTLAGPRVRLLSQSLGARGLWAVITLRVVPLAPFAVANMAAGATHIRLRDLLLGTLIGMSPSILAMAFFMDWILAWLQDPQDLGVPALLLALGLLLLVLGLALAWRRRKKRQA